MYKNKKYFGVSSLGRPLSEIKKGAEPEQKRVEEPFAWIMSEWGWIDCVGETFIQKLLNKCKYRR
jgi:hypothetical protein